MGTIGTTSTLGSAFSSNIATILSAVLAGFGIWIRPGRFNSIHCPPATRVNTPSPCFTPQQTLKAADTHIALAIQSPQPARQQTLRVIRFIDADLPAANAGRMVISGRMSDVCAELDRLAA